MPNQEPTATLDQLCAEALARPAAQQAVEYQQRWYSWGELREVAEAAAQLVNQSRAPSDATIALIPRNRPNAIATLFGLLASNHNVRMVYPFQSGAALARNIEQIGPAAVVLDSEDCSEPLLAVLREKGIATILLNGMSAAAAPGLAASRVTSDAGLANDEDKPRRVDILTSGTTGPPKSFSLSYDLLTRFVAESRAGLRGANPLEAAPLLLCFPLGNITGIRTTLPTLIIGQRLVALERFTLEGWHDYLLRFRPAATGMPPAGVRMILNADIPKEDLSCLTYFGTGAAPLDPATQRAFEERYGIPILLSYGATEFGGPVSAMTTDLHAQYGEAKLGSAGPALPGSKLRVIDPETGQELPPGEEGLLEAVAPRMGPDWIRTSDVAVVDEDGFLFLRGRADGAIMRGGFKLLPETIENALVEHPAVSAAGVAGVPDERLGQVPVAAIQLNPDATAPSTEELERHLRDRLPATHIPVAWRFVDSLPRTASFKVDQRALRELLATAREGIN